jgi:hypothetical protein
MPIKLLPMFAAAFVVAFIAVAESSESSMSHAEAAPPNSADQSPIGGIGVRHWFTLNKTGGTALRRCNIGSHRVVGCAGVRKRGPLVGMA